MSKKKGFTLVEMLVVIAIIALLAAIALPALSAARESGRRVACQNNLRQIYISLATHADRDPQERYCTGAFDGRRDGAIDVYGWVADMVNSGTGKPQELLCGSNPAKLSEKMNDYLGGLTSNASEGTTNARLYAGSAKYWNGGFTAPPELTDKNGDGNIDDADGVIAYFLEKGYNSNYASSWFLVRGAPQLVTSAGGAGMEWIGSSSSPYRKIKALNGTTGPLRRNVVEQSYHTSSLIPLMFDANVGDSNEAALEKNLGDFGATGARTVESFSDGPVQNPSAGISAWTAVRWDAFTSAGPCKIIDNAAPYNLFALEQPASGSVPDTGNAADHLQDWRDMGPVHSGQCNVLFADGSVRTFKDVNRDGFLNPGFNINSGLTEAQYLALGYRDNIVELPASSVFSGVFVEKQPPKTKLD